MCSKGEDGWWFGHKVDNPEAQGLFPSNYVTPSEDSSIDGAATVGDSKLNDEIPAVNAVDKKEPPKIADIKPNSVKDLRSLLGINIICIYKCPICWFQQCIY